MSITMTKGEGVTVFALSSNPKSACPPLCQIFGALCYSPVCCSLSQGLKVVPRSLSALACIQIMVGLLTLGLGAIRISSIAGWEMRWNGTPFWFGGVLIGLGFVCILVEKFQSLCLSGINVVMSLMGVGLAITAIVFYVIDIASLQYSSYWLCRHNDRYDYWSYKATTAIPMADNMEEHYFQKCREGKEILVMLVGGLDIMLIILGVLELCVSLSIAVLGIKAMHSFRKEKSQSAEDPEPYQSLVNEANTTSPA